jgi:hypothetical protein
MNNKLAKKIRKHYKKSIDNIANKNYRGILLKICRQRDICFVLCILFGIIIIVLSILFFWK